MKLILLENLRTDEIKRIILFSFISLILLIPLHFVLHTDLGLKGIFATLLIVISLVAIFNFDFIFYIFLSLIFLPYFVVVHQAVLFTAFIVLTIAINYKGNIINELDNPIVIPFLIYLSLTLPSLINTPELLLSLRDMSNMVALFIVFMATILGYSSQRKMMGIFYFFITMVFIHSLYVIYLGIASGARVFGILSYYYIDFAGLGGITSFVLVIYLRGIKKVIAGFIFMAITFGLILTQTRNAWLSFGFAIITLMIYLLKKGSSIHVKRSTIFATLVISLIVLVVIFLFAGNIDSTIEKRFDMGSQKDPTAEELNMAGSNSLLTRALIWHTSVMAYLEHPIIGIGAYSFRHISAMYYKIPKDFFTLFVEGRTPHVTYLQVITETGIIGFIGFLIFIFSIIREIKRALQYKKNKENTILTLMICWSFVYIIFSMFMTESWLYGQYVVWIGVLLGLLINNSRLLYSMTVYK